MLNKLTILYALFLTISCGTTKEYITSHGINVYCNEDVCFDKQDVEIAFEHTTHELALQDIIDKEELNSILEQENEMHSLYVKKVKYGDAGSCPTDKMPDRKCAGFRCSVSDNGWCAGLYNIKNIPDSDIVYSSIYVAKFSECPTGTALVHEFIHFIVDKTSPDSDPFHTNEKLWPNACNELYEDDKDKLKQCKEDTILRKANTKLCKDTCKECVL